MKIQLFFLFVSLLITFSSTCFGQEALPLNLNDTYLQPQSDFNKIKVIRTYDIGDYKSEQIHLFNSKGLNFKTISYYKGEIQGFTLLTYDSLDRLIKIQEHSQWIDNSETRKWDSTKVSWINKFHYDSIGRLERCTSLWFNYKKEEKSLTELNYEYDYSNRVIVENEIWKDLEDSSLKVRFKSNSDIISDNQNFTNQTAYKRLFEYTNAEDVIKNYNNNELITIQKIQRINDLVHFEYLLNSELDTLRFTETKFNLDGKRISEIDSGDPDISLFGNYGDGINWSNRKYEYNQSGLIARITYSTRRDGPSLFIEYHYIEKESN